MIIKVYTIFSLNLNFASTLFSVNILSKYETVIRIVGLLLRLPRPLRLLLRPQTPLRLRTFVIAGSCVAFVPIVAFVGVHGAAEVADDQGYEGRCRHLIDQ